MRLSVEMATILYELHYSIIKPVPARYWTAISRLRVCTFEILINTNPSALTEVTSLLATMCIWLPTPSTAIKSC